MKSKDLDKLLFELTRMMQLINNIIETNYEPPKPKQAASDSRPPPVKFHSFITIAEYLKEHEINLTRKERTSIGMEISERMREQNMTPIPGKSNAYPPSMVREIISTHLKRKQGRSLNTRKNRSMPSV